MEIFYAIVLLVVATIAANLVYPLFPAIPQAFYQIFAGAILSIVPYFHHFGLEPEVFMLIIIAPLMFYDGQNTDTHSLRRHIPSVVSMAITLAILTVILLGYLSHSVLPALPLALAFALAAIVTPTDAVAVSSITRNLTVPKKVMGMLERESLFNDASGLVAFNLALAAFSTGKFSVRFGITHFLVVFLGGLLIGLILGGILTWGRVTMVQNGMDSVSIIVPYDILTPFFIYLVAEHFKLSGILAVVAAGLLRSTAATQIRLSSTQMQLVTRSTWQIMTSLLNGFVFVLLGVSLPTVWQNIMADHTKSLPLYILLAVILYVVMFLLRYLWIHFDWARIHSQAKNRRHYGIVGALSGIHGTITLAMAFSLPLTLNGQPFPFRNTLIFIAAVVIIISLLVPAIVLPLILPSAEKAVDPAMVNHERQALVAYAAKRLIQEQTANPPATQAVVEILTSQSNTRLPNRRKVTEIMTNANNLEIQIIQKLADSGDLPAAYVNRYIRGLVWKMRRDNHFSLTGLSTWLKLVFHRLVRHGRRDLRKARRNLSHEQRQAMQDQRQRDRSGIWGAYRTMEQAGYTAVMAYLADLSDVDNQSDVNVVRNFYNVRHRRMDRQKTNQLENELFIQAFQYEYNYVHTRRASQAIPAACADELYQQIATDQMLYMQTVTTTD
ncbi:sodium:proton antiporter [Levilactobacillus namurensis]|uniref:cation:proton antiporter n=1 Tax=Levilactobacillus namurensis TaxID=380393 RepID=UPI0028B943CE|nr:sodium:proton antiporter [Levilactobacillus namurensis]MDT7019617.1 sodium:proton antiporter [Levilactobacillus namurensis]WNN65799.1 sodium:proton antiporter [Levilactobacillus namurensis]